MTSVINLLYDVYGPRKISVVRHYPSLGFNIDTNVIADALKQCLADPIIDKWKRFRIRIFDDDM